MLSQGLLLGAWRFGCPWAHRQPSASGCAGFGTRGYVASAPLRNLAFPPRVALSYRARAARPIQLA